MDAAIQQKIDQWLNGNYEQSVKDEIKKLQKKFMKQSVAMASSYLQQSCQLDVSIIDVEIYIPNIHLLVTMAVN